MTKVIVDVLQPLGLTQADIRDPFLRQFQRVYDDLVFDQVDLPLVRAGIDFRYAKTEHIGNHIGKALGKVLKLERQGTQFTSLVRAEAFPDTLMYRTQLANTHRYDLRKRLGSLTTDSTSLLDVDDLLTEARIAIDHFDERLDHGIYEPRYRRSILEIAIPSLHEAGLIMGNIFNTDPREAHADRLFMNMRRATTLIA